MPAKKYFDKDIIEWINCYNQVLSISKVSRKFNIEKCTISQYFREYKDKFGIKYKDEIQEDLFKCGKRMCLPVTGCGQIKEIKAFSFRRDSGKYKEQCIECRIKYERKWRNENKEHMTEYNKNYGKTNRKKLTQYETDRKKNNLKFRIIKNIRTRISNALKGKIKNASAKEYIGCSVEELKIHLESKFYPHPKTGEMMSWNNYGFRGWHIDHIVPLSVFDLTIRDQLLVAGHFTNLQPLWAEENLSKSDKIL